MAQHMIADYLLRTAVGIKVESGIRNALIQMLINEFAAEQPAYEPDGGMAGFLRVEDIPHDRRGEFLSALDWLGAHAR